MVSCDRNGKTLSELSGDMGLAGATDQRDLPLFSNSDKDLHRLGREKQSSGNSAANEKAAFQRGDRHSVAVVFSAARILWVACNSD